MYSLQTHPGILNELIFNATRSSGPGGQNVNKVSSKIELRVDIKSSSEIKEEHKELLIKKLSNKINSEGFLIITSQEYRSQIQNKENALEKFFNLINSALITRKRRRPTKPSFAAKQERLKTKKIRSERKATRKYKPDA